MSNYLFIYSAFITIVVIIVLFFNVLVEGGENSEKNTMQEEHVLSEKNDMYEDFKRCKDKKYSRSDCLNKSELLKDMWEEIDEKP